MHISAPFRTNRQKALSTLKKLFQCVSLRRTKEAVINELQLTPRSDVICEVQFNLDERRLYDVIKQSLSYIFHSDNPASGSSVLQTITRLRQFCNHGLDLLPSNIQVLFEGLIDQGEVARALITGSKYCDGCGRQSSARDLGDLILRAIPCGHTFCPRCMPEEHYAVESCPLCAGLEVSQIVTSDAQNISNVHRRYQPSSKVLALLQNLSAEQNVYPPVKRYENC